MPQRCNINSRAVSVYSRKIEVRSYDGGGNSDETQMREIGSGCARFMGFVSGLMGRPEKTVNLTIILDRPDHNPRLGQVDRD